MQLWQCQLKETNELEGVEMAPMVVQREPTQYERRLHQVCKSIPRGKVATYGLLAKALHSSPRAVGQALRRNPYAPVVPCHRVIAADLTIGGFNGTWGETAEVRKKLALLEQEGVQFKGRALAGKQYLATLEEVQEA